MLTTRNENASSKLKKLKLTCISGHKIESIYDIRCTKCYDATVQELVTQNLESVDECLRLQKIVDISQGIIDDLLQDVAELSIERYFRLPVQEDFDPNWKDVDGEPWQTSQPERP